MNIASMLVEALFPAYQTCRAIGLRTVMTDNLQRGLTDASWIGEQHRLLKVLQEQLATPEWAKTDVGCRTLFNHYHYLAWTASIEFPMLDGLGEFPDVMLQKARESNMCVNLLEAMLDSVPGIFERRQSLGSSATT